MTNFDTNFSSQPQGLDLKRSNRFWRRLLIFAVLAAALIPLSLYISYYERIEKVPRLRVGPLHTERDTKESLRIVALGDTGTGGEDQYAVAAAMEKRCQEQGGFDAIFLLGDNAYMDGMHSVDDPQWEEKVVKPYGRGCLGKATIFPVLGNHDYRSNPTAQVAYTSISDQWWMPNRFYSVDFGYLLKIVAIDSNLPDLCLNPQFCSLDYMRASLAQPTTMWRFVLAHHPIASASAKGHSHSGGLRQQLLLPMICNQADILLAGHAHMMEHRSFSRCRLEQFISGGGGGDLNDIGEDQPSTHHYAAASHGFLELVVSRKQIDASFFDEGLNTLYQTTIFAEKKKVPRP